MLICHLLLYQTIPIMRSFGNWVDWVVAYWQQLSDAYSLYKFILRVCIFFGLGILNKKIGFLKKCGYQYRYWFPGFFSNHPHPLFLVQCT